MGTYLKYLPRLGPLTAILLSVVALALWIPEFLTADADTTALGLTMALVMINGVCLMLMFYFTNVTRYREPLSLVLYLWFVTAFPELHTAWQPQLAVLLFTPVVVILQRTRLNPQSQEMVFIATLLILLASFLLPMMLGLIPVLWLALVYQQSLSLRSFLASWVAIMLLVVYLVLGHIYFAVPLPWSIRLAAMPIALSTWITLAVAVLLAVVILGQVLWRIHKENNHTRFVVALSVLIFLVGGIATLIPSFGLLSCLPMLYAATWMAAIYFWQRDSTFRGVFFLLLLILCLVANLV